MSKFLSNWKKEEPSNSDSGLGNRLKNAIRSPEPLKPKLEEASRQIQIQVSKLNGAITRLKDKDATIFQGVISSIQKHDTQHANMLANELTEIRKMSRLVTQAKLAFEQIELRINTIKELGDVATMLSPAMGIIKSVAPALSSVVPEAQSEIGEISSLLSGVLVEAGQMSGSYINFEAANDEADRVLTEAAVVAEQRMKDKFPDLPQSSHEGQLEEEAA
jgi:division protein CdvB (Snf7/Vps24/ESCRT-III family)